MGLPARRLSRTLFLHVAREFLIPLACSLLAFAFLFMVNNVFDDLPDFIAARAPWTDTALYFLALQPHNLVNVIPVSVLLATSFMTMMLGRSNELCAMRAAGLSLAACALPIWLTALAATAATALIAEGWGQACTAYAANLKATHTDKGKKTRATPISTSLRQLRRDWAVISTPSPDTYANVVLTQFDEQDNTLWLVAAKQATCLGNGQWRFDQAVRLDFAGDRQPQSQTRHDTLTLDLPELPLDISAPRSFLDSLSGSQALALLHRVPAPPPRTADRLRTIAWYQFTFPLASIVAACFGFAMTITGQRSEAMRGFAGAVGLLVLYYIVGQVLFVAGKNGWLPPFVAGALPNLLFTTAGAFLVWRRQ